MNGPVTADVFAGYRDRWDLLALPTTQVEVLPPEWVTTAHHEERIGLPPGHPWRHAA